MVEDKILELCKNILKSDGYVECFEVNCSDCPLRKGNYCYGTTATRIDGRIIAQKYIEEHCPIEEFNWEDFRNGKISICCDTEEKAKDFIKKAHSKGLYWNQTRRNETNYKIYSENTCYIYNYDNCGNLGFNSKQKLKERYKIIKWEIREDIMDNFKFKVGDIVTGVYESQWIYGEECKITKSYLNKNGRNAYKLENSLADWDEEELKLVEKKEDIKMEKTFREVIADIKEGEVWESNQKEISINNSGQIVIELKKGFKSTKAGRMAMDLNRKYTLIRKQYTFTEAFKAYEEGKEIESCVSGNKWGEEVACFNTIAIKDIQGKWYINN